jgi:hypothetical protein
MSISADRPDVGTMFWNLYLFSFTTYLKMDTAVF